jgi:hypothetical protein
VAIDVKKLRPTQLCGLLNSTPLGEVINARKLQRHRERAGLRLGGDRHVDLFRYVAWLFQMRHAPSQLPAHAAMQALDLADAAQGTAEVVGQQLRGHGQKFTRRHEQVIAALLTEPTYAQAATKAGISRPTLYRWLQLPEFHAALRQARRALHEASVGRMQAMSSILVNSVLNVALHGRRDSDRTRASFGLLDRALRGLPSVDALQGIPPDCDANLPGTAGSVRRLETLLEQVEQSDLPIAEKARLTATLTETWLRVRKEDEMVQRMEAVEAVLRSRKETTP